MRTDVPALSVVVAAHGNQPALVRCLAALERSDLPREAWELVVVLSEASGEDAAPTAAEHAQTIVRLPGRHFEAPYTRNRGFEVSRAPAVAFVSEDVCVGTGTLRALLETLEADPRVAAACAVFEPPRPSPNAISTFFHLRELYRHQRSSGETDVLHAGCCAVRRDTFAAAGMWDEWRVRLPRIEAIEAGQRIRALGGRIVMRGDVRVTHLRRYTFGQAAVATVTDHGLPYEEIPAPPVELQNPRLRRVRRIERAARYLSWGAVLAAIGAVVLPPDGVLAPRAVATAVGLGGATLLLLAPMYRFFFQEGGVFALLTGVPLSIANSLLSGVATAYAGTVRRLIGEPRPGPAVEALAEVGLEVWPPVPMRRQPKV